MSFLSKTFSALTRQFQPGGFIDQTFGESYRGIGINLQSPGNIASIAQKLETTVTGLDAGIGKTFSQVINGDFSSGYNYIKGLPITPNFDLQSFVGAATNPFAGDNMANVLKEVTGVNINLITENVTGVTNVKMRIKEYILGVERQVILQVKDCIDGYLQSLLNKNPFLKDLLDIEGFILTKIGQLRQKVRFSIEDEINKILLQKIQIQQIALFKQKITGQIRKICPSHHSPPPVTTISPTLTKKLQTDTTWMLADGIRPVKENALQHSPQAVHYAEQPNSTGVMVEVVGRVSADEVSEESLSQTVGYNTNDASDYINSDGSLA